MIPGILSMGGHYLAPASGEGNGFNEDAVVGISFLSDEYLVNGVVSGDLSDIFNANYDPSKLMEEGLNQVTNPFGTGCVLESGDVFDALTGMDWAVRIEFKTETDATDGWLLGGRSGFDIFGNNGDCFAEDWNWNAEVSAGLADQPDTIYALAASNNAAGWLASLNGATAVLSDPQSAFTATHIGIGNSPNGAGAPTAPGRVYFRKVEFFAAPLDATALEALSGVS